MCGDKNASSFVEDPRTSGVQYGTAVGGFHRQKTQNKPRYGPGIVKPPVNHKYGPSNCRCINRPLSFKGKGYENRNRRNANGISFFSKPRMSLQLKFFLLRFRFGNSAKVYGGLNKLEYIFFRKKNVHEKYKITVTLISHVRE